MFFKISSDVMPDTCIDAMSFASWLLGSVFSEILPKLMTMISTSFLEKKKKSFESPSATSFSV